MHLFVSNLSVKTGRTGYAVDKIGGNALEMIGDGDSSLRSLNFIRFGGERPVSTPRTFECTGLMIGFECTVDWEDAYVFIPFA